MFYVRIIYCLELDQDLGRLTKQLATSVPSVELNAMRAECESLRESLLKEQAAGKRQVHSLEKRLANEVCPQNATINF